MIARLTSRHALRIVAALTMLSLAACEGVSRERADADGAEDRIRKESGKLFGDINLLGGQNDANENNGIGVNGFLWRASLDTISFLPLTSADPFGGRHHHGLVHAAGKPGRALQGHRLYSRPRIACRRRTGFRFPTEARSNRCRLAGREHRQEHIDQSGERDFVAGP